MRIDLSIQSAPEAASERAHFEDEVISIGRDPSSTLRFDMSTDLEVSTRHAELRELDGVCVIVDKDSTNGTWVNGGRVRGHRKLNPGDVINLGRRGPELRVEAIGDDVWHRTMESKGLPPVPKYRPRPNKTREWLVSVMAAQTRAVRLMVAGVVAVVGVLGYAGWLYVRALAVDDPLEWREVTMPGIRKANDDAVVLIETSIPVPTCRRGCEGTGFAITQNGLIVTNRHVVVQSGVRATSIKVKFANTTEWLPARLVRVADEPGVDLALIQLEAAGPFPAVVGVSDDGPDLPVGSDVMTIGFPRGTALLMDSAGSRVVARTTTTAGAIAKTLRDQFQIDASADHGSSGSPVFDRHGHAIGVVSGGAPNASARAVYVVPADRIASLAKRLAPTRRP
jgi:S1-C subfamily serine protease